MSVRRAVRLYRNGGPVEGHLQGAAESVRSAGRREDDILVHVNKEEFDKMREVWGDPIMNPDTGMPEWGFMDSLKKVLKKALPVLSIASLIPGLQFLSPLAALSKGVGAVSGLGSMASNTIAGGVLGGATGGKRGALAGAIGGFAGAPSQNGSSPVQMLGSKVPGMSSVSPEIQGALGRTMLGAGSAKIMGTDPLTGGVTAAMVGSMTDRLADSPMVQRGLTPGLQQAALGALKGAETASLTGGDYKRGALIGGAAGIGNVVADRYMGNSAYLKPEFVGPQNPELQAPTSAMITQMTSDPTFTTTPEMFAGFSTKDQAIAAMASNPDQRDVYDALGSFNMCDSSGDFGACLAQNWDSFMGNLRKRAPTINLARGGALSRAVEELAVRGHGDGQDDLIDAKLSDGEYVFSADVVSALGSGSTEAGYRALDKMVENIRADYRSAPNNSIPPKAASPLQYLTAQG